jgi:methylthioribose-1-phosphate isomerase
MRSVFWDETTRQLKLIDQRCLPAEFVIRSFDNYKDVARAIFDMTVRGAPAIGVASAYAMALAGLNSKATSYKEFHQEMHQAGDDLVKARPTAVNLAWAVNKMLILVDQLDGNVESLKKSMLSFANQMADNDVASNKKIAEFGASLIQDGDHIVHHCNTGALAVVVLSAQLLNRANIYMYSWTRRGQGFKVPV